MCMTNAGGKWPNAIGPWVTSDWNYRAGSRARILGTVTMKFLTLSLSVCLVLATACGGAIQALPVTATTHPFHRRI